MMRVCPPGKSVAVASPTATGVWEHGLRRLQHEHGSVECQGLQLHLHVGLRLVGGAGCPPAAPASSRLPRVPKQRARSLHGAQQVAELSVIYALVPPGSACVEVVTSPGSGPCGIAIRNQRAGPLCVVASAEKRLVGPHARCQRSPSN